MKVNGSGSAGATPTPRGGRPVAEGFSAAPAQAPRTAARAPAGALNTVSSLDALLALQEALSPTERRRRAVRRAGGILDALDALKLATLDPGEWDASALHRLSAAMRGARDETEDPGLEDVLDQIELRAAVELAKRFPAGMAA